MELDATEVLADVQDTILDLAYTISKKINLDLVRDEQLQAAQLVALSRVYNTGNNTAAEKLQILSGLSAIANLTL